jgi:hypothetical protein
MGRGEGEGGRGRTAKPNLVQHAGDEAEAQAQGHRGTRERPSAPWGQGKPRQDAGGVLPADRQLDSQTARQPRRPTQPARHAQRPSPPCAPTHLAPRLPNTHNTQPSPSNLQHCAKHSAQQQPLRPASNNTLRPATQTPRSANLGVPNQPTTTPLVRVPFVRESRRDVHESRDACLRLPPQSSARDVGRRLQSHEQRNACNLLLEEPLFPLWLAGWHWRQTGRSERKWKQRQGPDPQIGTGKRTETRMNQPHTSIYVTD